MKKLITLVLALTLALSLGVGALADTYTGAVLPASVLLMDPDSGEVLYEKAADSQVYPASTTKILTTLVVLDHTDDLQATVTVDGAALSGIIEGDDSTLEPMLRGGETVTVEQLLYGLMLVSGNDCAAALAAATAGSIDAFAQLMNEKAAELGMTNSHFTNPHGVQDSGHYTTARDMAKLCAAAMENEAFMQIISATSYLLPATNMSGERMLYTSNRLMLEKDDMPGTYYAYARGMKTGYTPTAGGCLVSCAEKDGRRLICLVYGDGSPEQRDRWFLTKDLYRFGFGDDGAPDTTPLPPAADTVEPEASPEPATAAPSARHPFFSILRIVFLALFILVLAFIALRVYQAMTARRRPSARRVLRYLRPLLCVAVVLLAGAVLCGFLAGKSQKARAEAEPETVEAEPADVFAPGAIEGTLPSNWGIRWTVMADGQETAAYERAEPISFGDGADYFPLPGVPTFRGNNYRDGGSYGTADVQAQTISTVWSAETGSLSGENGTWTGSGWTGQPLIVQWDAQTRANMNLYDGKKQKDGLVEVIYATLDGHVYFLDLDDGSYTRDPISLGMPFKGAGALDPRGWPLFYVGSGDETNGQRPRMFIVSLVDGSVLYEYGDNDSFSLRQDHNNWCAFDSSPLVDAGTDTLIWPGESGVLYTIKLNTAYDAAAGTLSIAPDEPVRTRYDTARSGAETYWYGYECSSVIVDRYLYLCENGGMFFCIDLDTMQLIWAQDTRDDSNATPVFEPDGAAHGYVYTAPSLHWTADSSMHGTIHIYKLDAVTGEIAWSRGYDCYTVDGVSGGVQSSPVLGRAGSSIDGLVVYSVSRSPDVNSGLLVALDTRNGSEVWRLSLDNYAWSSPLALYGSDGSAWIVLCDSAGNAMLIEGATGRRADSVNLGTNIEASPAAFGNTLVVGTRGQRIQGMRVS